MVGDDRLPEQLEAFAVFFGVADERIEPMLRRAAARIRKLEKEVAKFQTILYGRRRPNPGDRPESEHAVDAEAIRQAYRQAYTGPASYDTWDARGLVMPANPDSVIKEFAKADFTPNPDLALAIESETMVQRRPFPSWDSVAALLILASALVWWFASR